MAGNWPEGRDRREGRAVYVDNLKRAADRAAEEGVTLVIEPINTRDMPGYFLNTTDDSMSIIEDVRRDNLKLQLDLYHCQIMEGDLAVHIRRLAGRYAHVQIAGVPERHEPDHGEVNYPYLLELLDEVGYGGWVGCEYRPAGDTRAGLGWAKRWGCHG
jgi:hydroxypyruvate isomerase